MLKRKYMFCTLGLVVLCGYFLNEKGSDYRKPSSNEKSLSSYNYSRSYLTLSDEVSFSGITSKHGHDDVYVRRMFGKLIQKADSLSASDLYNSEAGVFKNYYTFLLAGIQVPYHESGLVHFRQSSDDICSSFSNNIIDPMEDSKSAIVFYEEEVKKIETKLKSKQSSDKKLKLEKSLKKNKTRLSNAKFLIGNTKGFLESSPYEVPFPHCSKIDRTQKKQQILFSNDYADIGLMMINANKHPKIVKSGDIFHVDRVIDYGMKILYKRGFLKIARNSERYSCLKGLENTQPLEYAMRLVRGAWAGRYNSGDYRKTCRFLDTTDIYYSNDVMFLSNLKKTFEIGKGKSFYHKFLPENTLERAALYELLGNIKDQTNNRVYIDAVLNTDYSSEDIIYNGAGVSHSKISLKQKPNSNKLMKEVSEVMRGKDRTLLNDLVVGDSEGDIRQYSENELTHIITGKNYNIRQEPKEGDNICGNTRLKNTAPVRIAFIEEVNSKYSQISSYNLEDILFTQECKELDFLYVSNAGILKVKNYDIIKRIHIKSWSFAKTRPSLSLSENLKLLAPLSNYQVLKYIAEDSGDVWFKVLLETGELAWVISNDNIEEL